MKLRMMGTEVFERQEQSFVLSFCSDLPSQDKPSAMTISASSSTPASVEPKLGTERSALKIPLTKMYPLL